MTARVLVVDDVLPNLQLLERKLTDEYFDVLLAQSGAEALTIAIREQPDIILLDVMMPEMDGFETCSKLKADVRTAHIPVVMVTALDQAEHRVRGLMIGADDFLVKPIRDVELYARVRSLTRLKMVMDELRARAATDLQFGLSPDMMFEVRHPSIVSIVGSASNLLPLMADDDNAKVQIEPAEDIIASLRTTASDLVLVDLTVSPKEGLRFISRIRSFPETRYLPILALVDADDHAPLVKAFELGISDCVKRPADIAEVKARVATLLRRKRLADRLRENVHLSIQMAATDLVTGLFSRHYMNSHLSTLVRRAHAQKRPLSLAVIDIDFFKLVNDRYGHAAGDLALREIGRRIAANVRNIDLAARYGGEEFVVLMPDTPVDVGKVIAERLRFVIASTPFPVSQYNDQVVDLSVSIGLAQLLEDDPDGTAVIARADMALYRAKHQGRNRIEVDHQCTAAA